MDIKAFYNALQAFDWYYTFTDDARVYWAGERDEELKAIAKTIDGGKALYEAFHKYRFSGESFGTTKAAKPICPE